MKHTATIYFVCFVLFGNSANSKKATFEKPVLIFQSGFEGTTQVVPDPNTDDHGALYEHIAGKDGKSSWNAGWKRFLTPGFMQVQYTGGDSSKRFAKIIPEPGNPKNHVMHYWLNDAWPASEGQIKARIQTNLYGITGGIKEFYQSVRVYLVSVHRVGSS